MQLTRRFNGLTTSPWSTLTMVYRSEHSGTFLPFTSVLRDEAHFHDDERCCLLSRARSRACFRLDPPYDMGVVRATLSGPLGNLVWRFLGDLTGLLGGEEVGAWT